MYSDDILSWAKRLKQKNGKCYLIKKLEDHYLVCFLSKKGVVKIGTFKDGMYCRYGFNTYGKLNGESRLDIWQSYPKAVSDEDFEIMISIKNGNHKYEEFDILSIKNIKH